MVKVIYTAFVGVLVPFYWHAYGLTNFLYFCDPALLLTLVALWLESPLLANIAAVEILLPPQRLVPLLDSFCNSLNTKGRP